MDLIKKLTGKNPAEYESVAKALVDNSDIDLFAKLVKQDDFLFDFIKNNVAKRIQNACSKDNYLNLLNFLDCYSPSYDTMIARVLHSFSGDELLPEMKEIYLNGNDSAKAYAVKYFSFVHKELLNEMLPLLRKTAYSDFEPLAINSTEVLSILNDEVSKEEALKSLESEDEFKCFDAVRFLAAYQAKDSVDKIVEVMKKSSFAENIASEIPYLMPLTELIEDNDETAALVLCYIVNAIPEIIPLSSVINFDLYEVFQKILAKPLNSYNAILLKLAKDKFGEFAQNEEYMFDSDKNTKDCIFELNRLLSGLNDKKLESLFYDELFEGSDFVFFAIDYANEIEELEALLDSENQTLVLKVLSLLKDKGVLTPEHKTIALQSVTSDDIKQIIEVL